MKTLLSVLTVTLFAAVLVGTLPLPATAYTGYAVCSSSDEIVPFDVHTLIPETPIPLPGATPYPYDSTMNADSTEVWIVDASSDHVVVFDMASGTISHTIPVGEYPNSIVFTDDDATALVSARDGDAVTLIRTSDHSVAGTLSVLSGSGGIYDGPGQMALNPSNRKIYAVDWYSDTLFEIAEDGSSVLRSVDIGTSLWQLVCDPNGAYIYITDRGADVVRVVDTITLTETMTLPVGDDPWGLDVSIEGSKLVVACEDDATVHVYDTSSWSSKVIFLDASADPRDVDILEDEKYAYVMGGDVTGTDLVYVIELTGDTLLDTFEVGGNPNCVAVEPQMTSRTAGVDEITAASQLRVTCHPNPFNPKTTVSYYVPENAEVDLAVFDVSGRRVATLERGVADAGEHSAAWSGLADDGHTVATGVYFVRLDALGGAKSAKVVLLK